MLITDPSALKAFYTPHRVWQGIPGVVHTKGGRTFVTFYSGQTRETYGNYCMVLRSENDVDFGEPMAVAKKEGRFRCFDPVLWIDPLGRLWFIWSVMPGDEVYGVICDDPDAAELQWGEEFFIGHGVMMNKPTVLSSGEWLFPIAMWHPSLCDEFRKNARFEKTEPAAPTGAYVYKTSDNGETFTAIGVAAIRHRSFDEHMILELKNGVLMMLVRTTYGIGVSYSYDRGKNWSGGEDSKLGGPCSRFHICRLRSGRVLLINHVDYTHRDHLTALLSEDDGKTYPYTLLLDARRDVSYPDVHEDEDGNLYVVYDRERGALKNSLEEAYACAREVLLAKITEEDIMHGELVSEGSFLQRVVSKLDKLEGDTDPYDREKDADTQAFIDRLLREECDVMEKIFERYPISCIDVSRLDNNKLDSLVGRFQERGENDRELLVKIVDLVRTAPCAEVNPHPLIERIQTYIEKNLAGEISAGNIAAEMNISVYYLSHLFKAVTGITLRDFRNEMRLTKAKQMLIGTDETISSIAIHCGFSNASYFSEVFSHYEKISPTDFRKYHAGR